MYQEMIDVGSITYAMEGRNVLRSKGFPTYIRRTPYGNGRTGCGYSLEVRGDLSLAEEILRRQGIPIRGYSRMDRL